MRNGCFGRLTMVMKRASRNDRGMIMCNLTGCSIGLPACRCFSSSVVVRPLPPLASPAIGTAVPSAVEARADDAWSWVEGLGVNISTALINVSPQTALAVPAVLAGRQLDRRHLTASRRLQSIGIRGPDGRRGQQCARPGRSSSKFAQTGRGGRFIASAPKRLVTLPCRCRAALKREIAFVYERYCS